MTDPNCHNCDCADPTALPGLAEDCSCSCHKNKIIDQFIKCNGLTMKSVKLFERPDQDENSDTKWAKDASHYQCQLTIEGFGPIRTLCIFFSQGSAIKGYPKLREVLDCLASDAQGIISTPSMEDWCLDYGYSPDSRQAELIYKEIKKQAAKLRVFLGSESFDELLGLDRL